MGAGVTRARVFQLLDRVIYFFRNYKIVIFYHKSNSYSFDYQKNSYFIFVCRRCGRLSPPGTRATLGTVRGGTMKRSGMVGSSGARRFRRRAADARRHLNIKKEDDLKVNLTF